MMTGKTVIKKFVSRESQEKRIDWLCRIQNNKCVNCFNKMRHPTKEHLIPRSMGRIGIEFIAASCAKCNAQRATRFTPRILNELKWRFQNYKRLKKIYK